MQKAIINKKSYINVSLGFQGNETTGTWWDGTATSTDVGYWTSNQPSSSSSQPACGVARLDDKNYRWALKACGEKTSFMCKADACLTGITVTNANKY